MLQIPCPHCGARNESEFSYGARPKTPETISDEEWAAYVFLRDNTKGVLLERWCHSHGCRRWFNVARDTLTYEILAVYAMGAKPPKLERKTYV
jgi:heterotetrameric sarcosine oxidase delta subunit